LHQQHQSSRSIKDTDHKKTILQLTVNTSYKINVASLLSIFVCINENSFLFLESPVFNVNFQIFNFTIFTIHHAFTKNQQQQAASLMERNNRLAHSLSYRDPHFWLFWGLGQLLGNLATSGAKSDAIFLLETMIFPTKATKFCAYLA